MLLRKHFLPISVAIILSACGGSPAGSPAPQNAPVDPVDPPPPVQDAECNPPADATMPAPPADGQSREGLICTIHIPVPEDLEIPGQPEGVVAFQVFEPGTLVGGEAYPMILDGHGFSQSKQTSKSYTGSAGLSVANGPIIDAGYGMISLDQAGHGETAGLIRVMDPDQEGKFLAAVLDWADDNLPWIAQGYDEDAEKNNMLLGAIGPSYGGGYQMLLHTTDPKHRIDVMIPQITWSDLRLSIFPGTVPKALWGSFLFGAGNSAGSDENRGNFDPYVQRTFSEALSTGLVAQDGLDYFGYHGMNYFCEEEALPTGQNGDDGTIDTAGNPYNVDHPALPPGKVHAVFWQGMRDTLFTFTEAYKNYSCLREKGGDVRLLTYQSGHNTLQIVPDPNGASESTIGTCGPSYDPTASAIAYFDLYLKGEMSTSTALERAAWQATVDSLLPPADQICMSLGGTDAVLVSQALLPVGTSNTTQFALPDTVITTGTSPATAAVVDWDLARDGEIIAGIAQIDIAVTPVCEVTNTCIDGGPNRIVVFAGLGVNRDGQWQLIDNQVMPIRHSGTHSVELIGVGERLAAGEQLAVLFYGRQEQFLATGSDNAAEPTFVPVTISGTVNMPLLQAADVVVAQ